MSYVNLLFTTSKDLDLKGTIITSVILQGGSNEWSHKWTPKKEKKRGTHACC